MAGIRSSCRWRSSSTEPGAKKMKLFGFSNAGSSGTAMDGRSGPSRTLAPPSHRFVTHLRAGHVPVRRESAMPWRPSSRSSETDAGASTGMPQATKSHSLLLGRVELLA